MPKLYTWLPAMTDHAPTPLKAYGTAIRIGALYAALAIAPFSPSQAQDGGPYLTRSYDSTVSVKREGQRRWVVLNPSFVPVNEGDSVRVGAGGTVRLCLRGGRCALLESGKDYGVARQAEEGGRFYRNLYEAARILGGLFVRQPLRYVRTTSVLAERSDEEVLPPALLVTAAAPFWTVLTAPLPLVWLPSTSATADTAMRVRAYRDVGRESCSGGTLVLDTLATSNRLVLTGTGRVQSDGARYRVELLSSGGAPHDVGCFRMATPEERSSVHARIAELRAALQAGAPHRGAAAFDEALFSAALLARDGYYYDAFLLLDGLLERAPGDAGLTGLWGGLLVESGVLDDLGGERR